MSGFNWDVTAYHSRVKNEILSLRDVTGSPRGSVNADKTIHNGLEAGIGGPLRSSLYGRLAWNWQDFRSARWVPERTPVDNMNTLYADPYAVADLRAEYRLNDTVSFQAGVTNLFDEKYASSTLVVDVARPDQAAFIPGEGRAFYFGTTFDF